MAFFAEVNTDDIFGAIRLDAEFYQPKYQENESLVRRYPVTTTLGKLAPTFVKGIFDINAEEYVETGIPFVRINNLKNCVIQEDSIAFISPERHAIEQKTALKKHDIILSKTAYAAASLVQLEVCNTSQDTIAVKTNQSEEFNAFLVVYLNSRFGLLQMQRLFQGNIQSHLSLDEARTITIPVPGAEFQSEIHRRFFEALNYRERSKSLYQEADNLLLIELGLDNLDLSNEITYERNFDDVALAGRLDAQHFQPKYYRVFDALKAIKPLQILDLESLLEEITNGQTPLHHDLSTGDVRFLTAEHIYDFRINFDSDKRVETEHHEKQLKKTQVKENDVLITIKGRIGNVAVVEDVPFPTNINQDVGLLRLKESIHPYYVAGFLNSHAGKALTDQVCTGQINPFLGLGNLRSVQIPILERERMNELGELIKAKVTEATETLGSAKQLLDDAKRRVEDLILAV